MTIPTVDDICVEASRIAYGNPLIENSYRGLIAEIIIGKALGPEWRHCSADWSGWDFEHSGGCRLEIKQSAARQTWAAPPKALSPSFDIRERTGYYEGALWTQQSGRLAHIYVFAYHPIRDDSADHRDPGQWQFYVVPASGLPPTKKIGLRKLSSLSPSLSWAELAVEIEQVRLGIRVASQVHSGSEPASRHLVGG